MPTKISSQVIASLKLYLLLQYPSSEPCRNLEFTATRRYKGKRLSNHVLRIANVEDQEICEIQCFIENNCFSYNIMTRSDSGNQRCELNNATHEGHERDLKTDTDYVYQAAESRCSSNPCSNNATCQTGFTERGYRCLCPKGFTGVNCREDVDECYSREHDCDVHADCINTDGSFKCICKHGYQGEGKSCQASNFSSAKEIYASNYSRENKAFMLRVGSEEIRAFCVLNDTSLGSCGGGGWTLVMKIDGKKKTFHFDSALWTNKEAYNLTGGETGFDTEETKLPTYWNTPFLKICLGMRIPGEDTLHFIAVNQSADSLHSLIADQQYRPTSLGRETWKSLLGSEGSLQLNCNKEGFNVMKESNCSKARIGIISNNEIDCWTSDSGVGFGIGGFLSVNGTCGNVAYYEPDNGEKSIKTMGYIFIQ
ncbi:uncharacterized protein LOC113677157 [Pocillopora damicornis]|uniref:uncharacterized protein LOC113677157 n=1 Tax=Pocillopora damicornis TaxID=46731 RepID=UPI000F553FEA|nr:uncharacterized protein LOC113677157 [Pocillopora damicornis]